MALHRYYRYFAIVLALAPVVFLAVLAGCTADTELGGATLNNALPDTRITGTPPVLRQADFVVDFNWTGSDPDGRIKGYQWKMTSIGDDGISVYDTLTIDPATGDTLNPWHFTTASDTTFIVTADSAGFLPDADLALGDQRFYQTHTIFVRSVDDKNAVDPTPAFLTFTSTTLAPTILLTTPPGYTGYTDFRTAPPTARFGWTGSDPDFELGSPARVRYLFKEAKLPDGSYVKTGYIFRLNMEYLVSFADSAWSNWITYYPDEEDRIINLENLAKETPAGDRIYYMFVIQAQDTAGAKNMDKTYGRNVHHFRVSDGAKPSLRVRETYLGEASGANIYNTRRYDIAQGQPLEFSWIGDASSYGGEVAAYRYGWDVLDVNNDDDPGWALAWGKSAQHLRSEERTFSTGQHTFIVECRDNSNLKSRFTFVLSVVPVPDPSAQRPLLLVDDVPDQQSNLWPNETGTQRLDNDSYRDAFWNEVLALSGGVAGFNEIADVIDAESDKSWGYREIVDYRTIIWATKKATNTHLTILFDYSDGTTDFVWLTPYQQNVGNVFMCGSGVLSNFHQRSFLGGTAVPWEFPIIYNTADDLDPDCGTNGSAIGFGVRRDLDDNEIMVGPERYPYTTAGISIVDAMSPQLMWGCRRGSRDRRRNCVGSKAVIVDPDFKTQYLDIGAMADTMFMNLAMDFRDYTTEFPLVTTNYDFGGEDEFFDVNVSSRTTLVTLQTIEDGSRAIMPMFRNYARYDWILDKHIAAGHDWYPDFDPEVACGDRAMNISTGRTVVDNVPIGILSFMTAGTKPGGKADIYWGFDPYRFNREEMTEAIRWVLGTYYGLPVRP